MSEKKNSTESPEVGTTTETENIEIIRTISRVPGNSHYYEKNGLRTEGDGVDHSHYNPSSIGFIMTVLGCAFALAGSQIAPLLYLTLGTSIAAQLGASELVIWMLSAMIVAVGAMAPFVGPLADLFGRKIIFVVCLCISIIGSIVCSTTPSAGGFIAGQLLLGIGAVSQELLAIAVVAEIVPTARRPLYGAIVLSAIIPWSPGTLYSQYMAAASWRWVGCALGIWNLITMLLIAIFYHPPPRVNSLGLTRKEVTDRIDFIGGFLLIAGLLLFLVGVDSGGIIYPWHSARIISLVTVGGCILVAFGFWEMYGATYPLFPRRIVHAPRPFYCMMYVIFAAGINYIPVVVFWPIESISVFDTSHRETGINTLIIGMCILGGAIVSALLLGIFKRHMRWVMTCFVVMQTVGSACCVLINPHDIRTAWAPLVLSLIGIGGVLVPNQVVVTIITPDDLVASVTALTVGFRAQAQVIGLSIFYNRFHSRVQKYAFKYIVPPIVKAGVYNVTLITDFVTNLAGVPYKESALTIPQLHNATHYEAVKEGVVLCFSHAFKEVFYITIPFGVTATIAAIFMGDISQYIDQHVAVVL